MSLAIPEPIRLPDLAPDRTARALRGLRWWQVRNTTTNLIQGSRLRIAMILFCSAVFWAGLFILFLGGFQFISLYVDLANTIVEYLFSMFFLSLLVMLFFSSGIILYTTLFHSREAAYLLTTPASTDRIFAYTFAEAIGFSSWGFFLLGSPLMVAYGLTVKAPAAFYAMFLLYLFSFVLIPGSVRAVAAITVANIFPRRQKTVLTLAVAGVLALLAILGIRLWRTPGDTLSGDWLGSMLNRLAFCQNPLWPSRWMSAGLLASAKGEWSQAGYHLMVLSAHAALLYLAAAVMARDLYRRGYSRVQGGRTSRRRRGLFFLDAIVHRPFFFLPYPIRLLILKDLRTFLRDPAQWSQFLIFFGLLAFYFLNIPQLGYGAQTPLLAQPRELPESVGHRAHPVHVHQPVHLPVALPGRSQLLDPGALAPAAGANPLEQVRLLGGDLAGRDRGPGRAQRPDVADEPHDDRAARGDDRRALPGPFRNQRRPGARLPNLRETDPSKIAAGFGGTLNLLVSLVFIFAIVTALALPCHLYFAGQEHPESTGIVLSHSGLRLWLSIAIIASLIVGILGTLIPLRIGIKAFRRMEF